LAGVVSRKGIEISPDVIQAVDLIKRTTLQDLANALGMKKSTIYSHFKEGCFRRHTNDIKFTLTDENKMERVKYYLSMLDDTNATTPTFDVNDPAFVESAQADGWDIWLTCQPPNSLDLNVLYLGFFAGIQALFHKGVPNNVEDIVSRVEKAYQDFPIDKFNRIFLTQQGCMMEVMKQNGGQYYDIPHMRKKTLEM
jgi:hypothetical protein